MNTARNPVSPDRASPQHASGGSRYLFVKHSEGWNVDRCTRWMANNGCDVDWCYPVSGQAFPDPRDYAGVVVFGGAGSANDCSDFAWVRAELNFIESCLTSATPLFGICLGAQMLARVLGASVAPRADGAVEIGFHRIDPTPSAAGFLERPLTIMQWHSEGFELPTGTARIATSDLFPNQAFRVDERTLGVQFHPEVNPDALAIWHERNRIKRPGQLDDADRTTMMADAHRHATDIDQWLDRFLGGWTRRSAKAA